MIDMVSIGEYLIDFVPSGLSAQGQEQYAACPGGAVANVAAVMAGWGHSTALITRVGDDHFGSLLQRAIQDVGVDIRYIVRDENRHTTVAFVHWDASGDRSFTFLRDGAADVALCVADIPVSLIQDAKILHFGSLSFTHSPAREATYLALDTAREAGCLISYDPNLRVALWPSPADAKAGMQRGLSYCTVLKIAEEEAALLTGCKQPETAARWLLERYDNIQVVYVTMGAQGAWGCTRTHTVFCPAFSVEAVDTTGAGDSFMAGVLSCALKDGLPKTREALDSAVRTGCACGAVCATRYGAIPARPSWTEVEALRGVMQ